MKRFGADPLLGRPQTGKVQVTLGQGQRAMDDARTVSVAPCPEGTSEPRSS